jgi:low affinity Fe/Cu permease
MTDATFHSMARETSTAVGRPKSFFLAVGIIALWGISGPFFHFSDTWQLIINTGTTIVTFLMVFLIQNTQNRDSKAIHLKLDELLRATRAARNTMMNLENMSDDELAELEAEFSRLRTMACEEDVQSGKQPKGTPCPPTGRASERANGRLRSSLRSRRR